MLGGQTPSRRAQVRAPLLERTRDSALCPTSAVLVLRASELYRLSPRQEKSQSGITPTETFSAQVNPIHASLVFFALVSGSGKRRLLKIYLNGVSWSGVVSGSVCGSDYP